MRFSFFLSLLLLFGLLADPLAAAPEAPVFQSGDKVVLIGNTLIERSRLYGQIEAALSLAVGESVKGLSFRNLGWSADSLYGDSRSYFGAPKEGRDRLAKNITELKPEVIFLSYGTGEAMSVEQGWTNEKGASETSGAGLEESLALFESAYQKLIELVRSSSKDSLRELVLISPPPLENLGAPLPDQTRNNQRIAKFRDSIKGLAERNNARFVDLFAALGGDEFSGKVSENPLTDNGVHFTNDGYGVVARVLVKELGLNESILVTADAQAKANFREAIVEKNRLFFHRWRPANETYLFLFRKHEQGQNAREIPMFDPLIAEQEKKIEGARALVFSETTKN